MKVPHLKVKKGWFEGLDPSFVDRYASFSMFDTEGTGLSEQPPQPAVPSNKVSLGFGIFDHFDCSPGEA